uniref:rRNA methyltransferase 2, mitochondrial n=1 Tax=Bionectria ochroleuca TaxID=29856 RepID=A0A8H7KAG7_BIOOC
MFSFSSKQYEFNYREEMKVLTAFPSRVNPYAVAWRRFAIQSSSTRTHQFQRQSSSSSNSRWKQRQGRDPYARDARLQGLKSRAAFKLLEICAGHKIFKRGQTVVDLGFAPGSWSQVALELTKPDGLIVGIDLLPAQPPKGVTTFQGDFLSPMVQKLVKDCILEMQNRRELSRLKSEPKAEKKKSKEDGVPEEPQIVAESEKTKKKNDKKVNEDEQPLEAARQHDLQPQSYIDMERQASHVETEGQGKLHHGPGSMNMVDVVLSDMLMNTSGIPFHDHARSLDLCNAALDFASDTLKPGGHFVCKVYVGRGDQDFEQRVRLLFCKVHRVKPKSSRSESREVYLIGLQRKGNRVVK